MRESFGSLRWARRRAALEAALCGRLPSSIADLTPKGQGGGSAVATALRGSQVRPARRLWRTLPSCHSNSGVLTNDVQCADVVTHSVP